jgi:glycopeptide antibiotics resistance protein
MIISFALYLTIAYFTVTLPLPTQADIQYLDSVHAATTNFDITYAFKIFFLYNPMFNGGGLRAGLLSSTFNQLLFNVLLTVPFGVYLRYYFKRNFWQTLGLTIALTLFFELTQLSGLYGIYPRPYRLFDVDDLLLNTIGGLVGFAAAPLLGVVFPSRQTMDVNAAAHMAIITPTRRFITFLIDVLLASVLSVGLSLLTVTSWWQDLLAYALFFGVIPYFSGRTLGQRMTGLAYEPFAQERWRILLRNAMLVAGVLYMLPFWVIVLRQILVDPLSVDQIALNEAFIGMLLPIILLIVIDAGITVFRPGHELIHERLSRAPMVVKN